MKIILLGAPGCGKGTLSEYLVKNYNFIHLSTGNLFRKVINENLKYSSDLKTYLSAGELVPDELTNKLVKEEIEILDKEKKWFILDGYPRTLEQGSFLDNLLDIDMVIYLNVDVDSIFKRLTGRRSCSKCGKIYNIYFSPTKNAGECDIDGALLIQRKDDEESIINTRLQTYNKLTLPLVNFYKNKNKLYEIDGNLGFEYISKKIDDLFKK
ncbi:MAG: nucleoside monophosphate kinase [Malacoplasma sp.]